MIKYSNIKMPPEHTINDITAFIGKKLRTSQPDPSRLKIIKNPLTHGTRTIYTLFIPLRLPAKTKTQC